MTRTTHPAASIAPALLPVALFALTCLMVPVYALKGSMPMPAAVKFVLLVLMICAGTGAVVSLLFVGGIDKIVESWDAAEQSDCSTLEGESVR